MKLSLMVTEGVHAGEVIAVNGVSLMIGRGPQCHVRPNSPAVDERHCNLTVRHERAFVRDLDSRTGTFLNDRQLRGEIELRDGDFLRIGPLVFVIQLEAAAAEPPPPQPYAAAETQELPAYVPEPAPRVAPETQELPAYVPEPSLHAAPEMQDMPVGAVAPSRNGARAHSARTKRRWPRPYS